MSVFDQQIAEVAAYAETLRGRGLPSKVFEWPGAPEALREGLPVKVGPNANPGIILRGDTFVELGNPQAGSCACLLWTDDPSLVADGRISLFGPDIPESSGASLPFGQVLIAGGSDLAAEDHEKLQQAQLVSDQIEGYMVRSASQNVWSRVSREAAGKGFDFETLGRALLDLVKTGAPKVSAMEILFVTTSKEDVSELQGLASTAKNVGGEILKEAWKARGYDLDCDYDCSSCQDETVCDEIRDVIVSKHDEAVAKREGNST